MDNQEVYSVLTRLFSHDVSAEEKVALESELNRNKDHQALYNMFREIMSQATLPETETPPPVDQCWQDLLSRLENPAMVAPRTPRTTGSSNRLNFMQRLAMHFDRRRPGLVGFAMAIVVILAAWLLQPLFLSQSIIATTENNTTKTIKLSDGSEVILNGASSLTYPNSFEDDQRTVLLVGEAFFDVAKDANRPFLVKTDLATTTVIGTRFNINSRYQRTRVVVHRGQVQVAANHLPEGNPIILNKGQMVSCSLSGMLQSPQEINIDDQPGWLEGKINFYQSPLPEIRAELMRIYNINITLAIEQPGQYSITGSFDKLTAEEIISSICLTLNLDYIIEDGSIKIIDR